MRAWVDIDNPPQARYLLPIARALEQHGHDVLVTARAHGGTFEIIRSEGVDFDGVGTSFGKGARRKLVGLTRRAGMLVDLMRRQETPVDFVVTGSRAATLAARRLDMPSFVVIDYEHVNLLFYELSRSYIIFPDVIPETAFRRRGVTAKRLLPFRGLKEDISFSGIDLDAIAPHDFGRVNGASARVLFRPPAEDSHYYRRQSGELAMDVLRHLALQDVQLVFSPRESSQVETLSRIRHWAHPPIVLDEPLPFVPLLKAVDAVVSGGGTMLREAAFLGVPAYSIFRGSIGSVDRYLAAIGRLTLLRSAGGFSPTTSANAPLRTIPDGASAVTAMILERLQPRSRLRRAA